MKCKLREQMLTVGLICIWSHLTSLTWHTLLYWFVSNYTWCGKESGRIMASPDQTSNCRFRFAVSFSPPMDKKQADCFYFLSNTCNNVSDHSYRAQSHPQGDACEYRHSEAAKNAGECRYWLNGYCSNGVNCGFQHPSRSFGTAQTQSYHQPVMVTQPPPHTI